MSDNKIAEWLLRCGMIQSVAGQPSAKFSVSYDIPEKLNTAQISRDFPDLVVRISMYNLRPGLPFVVDYSVTGPIDQIRAFIMKYGNEGLKEEMQRVL